MFVRKSGFGLYAAGLFAAIAYSTSSSVVAGASEAAKSTRRDGPITSSSLRASPSPLLAIDQNRTTVVERIVAEWGDALAASQAGLTPEQLRTLLTGLRADHLLAASLAGNIEGLRNIIGNAITSTADVKSQLFQAKAIGDAADDLVYTPVVPCRILDTRNFGGPFGGGGETRSYHAYLTSGTFAAQGGAATNCAIPANPAAAVLSISTIGGGGFLTAWPFGSAQPNASTLNPNSGIVSSSAVVPLCQPNCADEFSIFTFGANVVIDIVGYFKAPGAPVGTVTSVGTGNGLTGGPITGSGTINLAPSNLLPTTPCATDQVPKWNGTAWICATLTGGVGGGIGGGGTTNFVPLWTAGTTLGNSVIAQSGNNVGIGTTTPMGKLQVDGEFVLNAAGPTVYTGVGFSEQNRYLNLINSPFSPSASGLKAGGVLVSDSYGFANPGKNDLIVKGRVGVGNASPFYQLDVTGAIRASGVAANDVVAETAAGTNSWARHVMKTPEQEWALGTSRNYNGNQIYLSDDTYGQARMTIQPNGGAVAFPLGNVGIGTGNPAVKLHVAGTGVLESSVQSTNERAIVSLNSTIGAQNRVWTLENGLFGTAGLFGIYDRTAGRAPLSINTAGVVKTDGNVAQTRTKNGTPKALVRFAGNGALIQCYNGVDGLSGISSAECGGITSTSTGVGAYQLDFPFSVNDRYVFLTAGGGFAGVPIVTTYVFSIASSQRLFVYANKTDGSGSSDNVVTVLIF